MFSVGVRIFLFCLQATCWICWGPREGTVLWPCWRAWWSTTRPCTPRSPGANPAPSLQDSVVSGFEVFAHFKICLSVPSWGVCDLCCSPRRPDKVLRADWVSDQSSNRDAEGAPGGALRGQQDEYTLCLPGVRYQAVNGAGGDVQTPSVGERTHAETLVLSAARGHQAEGWEVRRVHALHGGHRGENRCGHAPPWPQPAGQCSWLKFEVGNAYNEPLTPETHNCDLWGKSSKGHGERSEMWASYLDVDWKDCPMYGWGGPLNTASVKICIMSVVAFSDVIRVTSARACSPYIVFQFSWGTQSLKDVYPSRRGW